MSMPVYKERGRQERGERAAESTYVGSQPILTECGYVELECIELARPHAQDY
jgi:hypothetical protein